MSKQWNIASKPLKDKIFKLTAENAELRKWQANGAHSINLGIAVATEKLQKENAELRAKVERAESGCAEMRKVLEACDTYLAGASQPTNRLIIKHALSTDYGKGILEKVKRLEGALKHYGRHDFQCVAAGGLKEQCTCGLAQALSETEAK